MQWGDCFDGRKAGAPVYGILNKLISTLTVFNNILFSAFSASHDGFLSFHIRPLPSQSGHLSLSCLTKCCRFAIASASVAGRQWYAACVTSTPSSSVMFHAVQLITPHPLHRGHSCGGSSHIGQLDNPYGLHSGQLISNIPIIL